MNLSIGLELADNDEAIGIVVPALGIGNYSCYSAADDESEIIPMVKEAISLILDDMSQNSPELVSKISDLGIRNYRTNEDFEDFNNWMVLDYDLSPYFGKQKRINISLSEGVLKTIDSVVESRSEYRDRSHFLEVAARHEFNI
ncbi:type II toxin-antitoxin system HicB family antitoxin [Litorilituus sediminis]|uniref:CopG family transcriptional regulator n=1 Tax=Litorilituus sediminis TaxID=718192 RepID=A0A4V0ZFS9_9GAMM|nr:type II toxin-antitoxin system HicB family antitoxin [Litorilituus sediminis]QBG34860.1 CopG family transcriptional regulator [Litorilituus sediminis]